MDVTSLAKLARTIIAPEANHLLSEPPGASGVPGDFGWFCREHVIVATAVFKALGHPLQVFGGHITIFVPGALFLSTARTPNDIHYWCGSSSFPILDLSASLQYIQGDAHNLGVILGEGKNGDFSVVSTTDLSRHFVQYQSPTVIYTPQRDATPLSLDPRAEFIAAAIAIHIIKLVRNESGSLRAVEQLVALNTLAQRYPDAMEVVQEIMQGRVGG